MLPPAGKDDPSDNRNEARQVSQLSSLPLKGHEVSGDGGKKGCGDTDVDGLVERHKEVR